MSLNEFLIWLGSGGSIVFVSWIAEKIKKFQELSKDAKQWVIYTTSVLLSFGAHSIVTYATPELLAQLAPYFTIMSATFASIFLGQVYHYLTKDKTEEEVN